MRAKIICLFVLILSAPSYAQEDFSKHFEMKSLRIDFALSGNSSFQAAAIEHISEEPVWGGPIGNLIDKLGYGGCYINVYDKETETLIYSRGMNTLFEEWLTTSQAKEETQSWTNTAIIPYPKETIVLEIMVRDRVTQEFASLLKQTIDPASIFIRRNRLKENKVITIQEKGSAAEKVDLVFIAEGYTANEQNKFEADARRFAEVLFTFPPFDRCRDDFNIRAVCLVSEESGTSSSGKGVYKNTALNSGYYTFGIDRYLTVQDMKPIRDAVWNVPCDAVFVLVNTDTYGGGGMYNFYAIGTADNERTAHVFIHEFGHSFAGLADEYFSSEVAYYDFYPLDKEPWEPNITTLIDFDSKWKDLLPRGINIPTSATNDNIDKTGVYEGGGYVSKGIYRPAVHCMMRDYAPFCPVCSWAILRMVDFLTDRDY